MEAGAHIGAHLNASQMSRCISGRGRTNISALYVADDHQAFFLAVNHGFRIYFKSLNAKLLVHCNLWFH